MSLQFQSGSDLIPWTFLEGDYQLTNKANIGDIVATSDPVPEGFSGIMRDSNIIFLTSGGGVFLRIKHKSGGVSRFTQNFESNATGLTAIVAGGDQIQVVAGSTGVGVITIVLHGELRHLIAVRELNAARNRINPETNFLQEAGL